MRCYREKCRSDLWGSFTERFDSVCSCCERRYPKGGARRSTDPAVRPHVVSTLQSIYAYQKSSAIQHDFAYGHGTCADAVSTLMQVNEDAIAMLAEHNPRLTEDNLFLCETCRISIKSGDVPAISIANKMALAPIPEVISALNPMEARPFMICQIWCICTSADHDSLPW
jgi:hypothetical protein